VAADSSAGLAGVIGQLLMGQLMNIMRLWICFCMRFLWERGALHASAMLLGI
jgi:hypothetical protein